MVKFTGSIIKEEVKGHEMTFAVVVVNEKIVRNREAANKTARDFRAVFPNMPIVLMAQDRSGVPIYVGRPDLVWFLADVPLKRIPWKQYTFGK